MTDDQDQEDVKQPRTCSLAKWSLALGISSVVIFCAGILPAIPAIVLGHLASSRIKQSAGLLKGRSMASVGTFLGYFILICWIYGIYHFCFQKFDTRQFGYHMDYEWQGIDVGTVANMPVGRVTPNGRYYSIVAFPSGRTNEQTVLYEGPRGELPKCPRFVSGSSNVVTYEIPGGGITNLTIRRSMDK